MPTFPSTSSISAGGISGVDAAVAALNSRLGNPLAIDASDDRQVFAWHIVAPGVRVDSDQRAVLYMRRNVAARALTDAPGIELKRTEEYLHLAGLELGGIVLAFGSNALAGFEERSDLAAVLRVLGIGDCNHLVLSHHEVVSRRDSCATAFFDECERVGARIHLLSQGGYVSWQNLRSFRSLLTAVASAHAGVMLKRSQAALQNRWLLAGRGWPGRSRFGFRRNPQTGHLEVDPVQ